MGNHHAGLAFAAAAKGFWRRRGDGPAPTMEEALAFLDEIGEEFRGADAEFDDELSPDTPLGRLIAIAFEATPEEMSDIEDEETFSCPWHDGPETRFRKRYDFC